MQLYIFYLDDVSLKPISIVYCSKPVQQMTAKQLTVTKFKYNAYQYKVIGLTDRVQKTKSTALELNALPTDLSQWYVWPSNWVILKSRLFSQAKLQIKNLRALPCHLVALFSLQFYICSASGPIQHIRFVLKSLD